MAKEKATLISDLPDYDDVDTDTEIDTIPNSKSKSQSLFGELNETNLLTFIIIFLILYKPSLDILNMVFVQIIPLDNQIANNALKALLIIIILIITRRYILS
jgi:hypothetical protein